MHKPSDRILLQPHLVFGARQVNYYDAMNLVAYAKVPLVSVRRAGDLVAGFIRRETRGTVGALLSKGQKDLLLERYKSEFAGLRYPITRSDCTMLQEKMLDAGETALPYFFHEHHELVHARRRAKEMAQIDGRLKELVRSGQLILQQTDAQLAGFPISSEAWMTQKSFRLYLEREGVSPFWEDRSNIESHARLVRIVMSDWSKISDRDSPDVVDEEQLPSYLHAQMLLQRSPSNGYAASPNIESKGTAPDQMTFGAESANSGGPMRIAEHSVVSAKTVDSEVLGKTDGHVLKDAGVRPAPSQHNASPAHAVPAPLRDAQAAKPRRAKGTKHDPEGDRLAEPYLPDQKTMLNRRQAGKLLGHSPGWVDSRRKDTPDFPKPFDFGRNDIKWEQAELLEWRRKNPRR